MDTQTYKEKSEIPNIKGYIDNTSIVLTSSKLKSFGYNENSEKEINNLEFKNNVIIDLKEFKNCLDYFKKLTETVTFEIEGNFLSLKSDNGLIQASIKIPLVDGSNCLDNVKGNYSTHFLLNFLKEFKFKDFLGDVTLKFNKDYPLYLELKKIGGGVEFLVLAPRIV
jgi:DNA mismatch repair ATPase MutS